MPRAPLMLLIAVSALVCGCYTIRDSRELAVAGSAWPTQPPSEDRRIRPGDALLISLVGVDTPPAELAQVLVMEDGTITLPTNRVFAAAGKTQNELETEFRDCYVPRSANGYVMIRFGCPKWYYMSGEVGSEPGRRTLFRRTTVLKAVDLAGGFTDAANCKKVELTRADGSKHIVNCAKAQRDTTLDLEVYPGDRIFVPRSFWKHVFSSSDGRLTNGLSQ
jgi:protein involved in polysaccharide export with SLBB domain